MAVEVLVVSRLLCFLLALRLGAGSEAEGVGEKFKIEGRAVVPGVRPQDWIHTARVLVEGEEHVGFFKTDGTFTVNDVPSGSYVVEIVSPAYRFEAVRVDITSKGKIREKRVEEGISDMLSGEGGHKARHVNYLKASEVIRLPYPIQIKSTGPPPYFLKRETWGWTDFLMNPMVMMMILPLLIILLLPKVVNTNDPDMRREMEQSMNMLNPNHELPDVSEFMTRLFSSKSSKSGSGSKAGKSGVLKRR
ncbi:ER membrane protein complex subunit 7 isoform X1 [Chiloscyllium plagiosum]|uniref:ER membrane protein complex subunit 7 isoform X1 n=1 Tax=Chiloscyllium plagiosum TaxID=36176 RepID=UPI001CB7CDE2|nr:ER membrane protein complex subunit 7 isoform X1 [Chiloscyllium plagiosum]